MRTNIVARSLLSERTRRQRLLKTILVPIVLWSATVGGLGADFAKGVKRVHFVGAPKHGAPIDNKVDPGLRYMANRYEAMQQSGSQHGASSARTASMYDGSRYFSLLPPHGDGIPRALVFMQVSDASNTMELERLGVQILTTSGNILVAEVPITRVYEVASLPNVLSILISGRSKRYLDLSRTQARVDQVHAGAGGLDRPYKGNGVIVGVIDSGIDWSHPDFSVEPNDARIQWLLDLSDSTTGTAGREWTKAQIDQGLCTEIDGQAAVGHGTHVAGIAAGGGKRNPSYVGMAPGSDIVVVKGTRSYNSGGGFLDADVVNGVNYVFTKTRAMNKPAIVNLSLGGHLGPHDGTSLYEQALSNLVIPGKIIVAAAGNEGSSYIHCSYAAQPGTGYTDALETPWKLDEGTSIALADMWYPFSGNISVGVAVYQVGNFTQPLAGTNPVPLGQFIDNVVLTDGTTNFGVVSIDATTTADPNNNARRVLFLIQDNPGSLPISNYAWSIYTFGNGTFDVWSVAGGGFPPVSALPIYFRPGDNNKSVGTPATAKKVVCVGAYVTKTSWVDLNGVQQTQPNAILGSISSFSSLGPTRDGRTKPDFVAPGEVIVAALSSSVSPPPQVVLQGGGLQKLEGTSMAAPHVTGIGALMLERNKYLSYENIVSILSSTAATSGVPNTYGAGKVQALNALLATPPSVDCATLSRLTGYDCDGNIILSYELLDAYPNPFNPATTIGFRLARPEKTELAIYDLLGQKVRTLVTGEMTEGFHQTVWDGTSDEGEIVASGVYFSRLSTPKFTAANRLVLVR